MVSKAVLMRSDLVSLTTARPVNTAQPRTIVNSAKPMTNVFNKAHSTVRRPINNKTTTKNSNFNKRVDTVSGKNVNTARPKAIVNTTWPKAVLNTVKGNQVNAVKASACWVWKPKTKGNPQQDLEEKGVIDSGCSRHMTGNMSYLTEFEEIDGGYVAFEMETSGILKSFITRVENLIDQKVKVIRCDNRTEFKNKEMNQFCERKAKCDAAVKWKQYQCKDSFLLPIVPADWGREMGIVCLIPLFLSMFKEFSLSLPDARFKPSGDNEKKVTKDPGKKGGDPSKEDESNDEEKDDNVNSTNNVNAASNIKKNKKDERGIVIKNKARLVAMCNFLMVRLKKKSLVCQHKDLKIQTVFLDRVYKVEKALYGLHQAPRAWYETLSTYLLDNGFQRGKIDKTLFIRRDKEFEKMMHKKFQMSSMGELTFFLGLQVKQKEDGIFISQDKYVTEILKKFGFTDVKTASTPMETQKPLLKDEDGEEVDVHLYRSMIGSLMYLTSSRPDIMFAVCACARYQVNPKVSHLHAVKRIFRYLKGQPKLGLWYPKDVPFDLVAYTDSDYTRASFDRKSTTGCCQFLGCRLISWQCKKQAIVANSTIEAEYVVASSFCGQVLWIQNQLLDYGYNFMHTKIYIDNESTICIVKNPIFH
ncbi:putative ribonuclease H-like domain-containing protein [Tanacetum coccineum]|uniref:Ribonuclease H-like domain-containing protein n=1 Tax=Tanacetum coccineum TaxID=301880 RepID=A0ABQ5CC28_9ASTR